MPLNHEDLGRCRDTVGVGSGVVPVAVVVYRVQCVLDGVTTVCAWDGCRPLTRVHRTG